MKYIKEHNMKMKKAFTMAEAILVMTILGIIATIMITTLKPAEFKKDSLKVLAKKVLSEIDTATTQVLVNNTKMGDFKTLVDTTGDFTFVANPARVLELYKKYLTTIRTEVESDKSFCLRGPANATIDAAKISAAYLKDGACIGFHAEAVTVATKTQFPGETEARNVANASQGLIYFDTNGLAEPNTLGEDQFVLPVVDSGIGYDVASTAIPSS